MRAGARRARSKRPRQDAEHHFRRTSVSELVTPSPTFAGTPAPDSWRRAPRQSADGQSPSGGTSLFPSHAARPGHATAGWRSQSRQCLHRPDSCAQSSRAGLWLVRHSVLVLDAVRRRGHDHSTLRVSRRQARKTMRIALLICVVAASGMCGKPASRLGPPAGPQSTSPARGLARSCRPTTRHSSSDDTHQSARPSAARRIRSSVSWKETSPARSTGSSRAVQVLRPGVDGTVCSGTANVVGPASGSTMSWTSASRSADYPAPLPSAQICPASVAHRIRRAPPSPTRRSRPAKARRTTRRQPRQRR